MLNLRNININVSIEPRIDEHITSYALLIEIEVFGQLGDEESLGRPHAIDLIGNALVEAIDTNDIRNKATVEVDGVKQEWGVPLVEAGEQLETDGLPWEFRCRRGAKGEGRWTVAYEVDLTPPEFLSVAV